MIAERGQEDWDSEYGRFPRLFRAAESVPGLTWPTVTFKQRMTLYLGKRRVELMHLGRAHTAGDIVAYVPDANVVFSGDIVEYKSACYCGDAHFTDWPATLDTLGGLQGAKPWCRAAAMRWSAQDTVLEGIALTREFLRDTLRARGARRGARRLAQGMLRRDHGGDAPQVRQLADLRALPAVQHRARLRRGPGHRHARASGPRNATAPCGPRCRGDGAARCVVESRLRGLVRRDVAV